MTITIRKLHLAIAVVAIAVLATATTALATHVFNDVSEGAFYHDAVTWAKTNEITTGSPAGSATFKPLDPVTRGESVTFLKRYDANIVQPTLDMLASDIAALEVGLFDSDTVLTGASTNSPSPVDMGLKAVVTIPTGHTAVIEIGFSAESACSGGVGTQWCNVAVLANGTAVDDTTFAFNNTNSVSATPKAHSMTRVTGELPPGTYEITATHNTTNASTYHDTFAKVLTATVHFLS